MSGYTTEEIQNIFNNHSDNSMVFEDPIKGYLFHLTSEKGLFKMTTTVNDNILGSGQVIWSIYQQAFVGNNYNIPISWKV